MALNKILTDPRGGKRKEPTLRPDGTVYNKTLVDYTVVMDERTIDGHYYASALKLFDKILHNPEKLDTPPETVIEDVD